MYQNPTKRKTLTTRTYINAAAHNKRMSSLTFIIRKKKELLERVPTNSELGQVLRRGIRELINAREAEAAAFQRYKMEAKHAALVKNTILEPSRK